VPGLERLDLLKPEDRAMLVVFCSTWSVGEVTSLGFGRKSQATKEKSMIEVLPDMPEGVTGIRVSGRLRGDNLREFKPAMEELLKTGEIRIVEVVAPDYEGFGHQRLFPHTTSSLKPSWDMYPFCAAV
jgi:hypothetical protein